jgi:hypothetical protein
MLQCYYLDIQGQIFGYTQLIPIFFLITMGVLKMVTYNCIWFMFGMWLYLPQFVLWSFQLYFQYIRPNPICAIYQSFAFPSIETFYLGICIGLFVVWTITYEIDQSWMIWTVIYCVGIVVPGILIYTQYNVWWETLFSFLFGFIISWMFVIVTHRFFQPNIKYLVHCFPIWHFGYSSVWVDELEFKKIDEVLRKIDGYRSN